MADLGQAAEWHRQVAALAEAADRAGVAAEHLPAVRARLRAQQSQFAERAARAGTGLPALVPAPVDIAAAAPAWGDLSGAAVARAVRTVTATLDATDAVLAGHMAPVPASAGPSLSRSVRATPGGDASIGGDDGGVPIGAAPATGPGARQPGAWRPGVRNGLVYGGYATFVLVVQLALLAVLDEERTLPQLAPVCLAVLPAFAWAAGWLTIGAAFPTPAGIPAAKRSSRLGVIICLLPNLVLCAGVGILFLVR